MCITATLVAHDAVRVPRAAPAPRAHHSARVPARVGRLSTCLSSPGRRARAAEPGFTLLRPTGASVRARSPGDTGVRLDTARLGGRLCLVAGLALTVAGVAGSGARFSLAGECPAESGSAGAAGVGRSAAAGSAPGGRTPAAKPSTGGRRADAAVTAVVSDGAYVPQDAGSVGGCGRSGGK